MSHDLLVSNTYASIAYSQRKAVGVTYALHTHFVCNLWFCQTLLRKLWCPPPRSGKHHKLNVCPCTGRSLTRIYRQTEHFTASPARATL